MSNINWTFLNEKLPTEKSSDDDNDDQWKEQRHSIFSQYFDVNNNGYCSLAECDKGLTELLSFTTTNDDGNEDDMSMIVTKPVIIRAFTSAKTIAQEKGTTTTNNTNNDYIEFSEFRYFLLYIKEYIKLWELFDIIDNDNDRRISSDEFIHQAFPKLMNDENEYKTILRSPTTDETTTTGTAESIFQSIDTNHGGYILFIELAQYMIQKKMMEG